MRAPSAAGTFYPATAGALRSVVERYIRNASTARPRVAPHGLIVPHAGYRYSGPVAASAYATLDAAAVQAITRVVVMGPAHFVALHGFAIPSSTAWRTPLGSVAIDADLARRAADAGAVMDDAPHAGEHALEVQLPFVQVVLAGNITVLPIAVGIADATRAADLVEALIEPGALLVVSTDLSHYHDDATAKRLDRRTAAAITARDAAAIDVDDACGVFALRAAVEWARRALCPVSVLDLRTSADTAGDASRVVGYGAFAIG